MDCGYKYSTQMSSAFQVFSFENETHFQVRIKFIKSILQTMAQNP